MTDETMIKTIRDIHTEVPTWSEENLAAAKELSGKDEDSFGFAFESPDEFSEAPMEFEEYTKFLLSDLSDIYYLTTIINRFSPNYIGFCTQMEKIIRLLGRCCVTRAVLEQKGFHFSKLEQLSIEGLYSCISFNFRKCHKALEEGRQKKILDVKLLQLECSLYELADRLRATGEKVKLIREGKVKADDMLERSMIFTPQQGKKAPRKQLSAAGKTPSLPVLGSVARSMIRAKKDAEKEKYRGIPGVSPFKTEIFHPVRGFPELEPEPPAHDLFVHEPAAEAHSGEPDPEGSDLDREILEGMIETWERATGTKAPIRPSEPEQDPKTRSGPERKKSAHTNVKKKKKKR